MGTVPLPTVRRRGKGQGHFQLSLIVKDPRCLLRGTICEYGVHEHFVAPNTKPPSEPKSVEASHTKWLI